MEWHKKSISGKYWQQRPHDERVAATITQRLGLPDLMGSVIASRNIGIEEAEHFLNPTLRHFLPDPFHLLDMEKAVERILQSLKTGKIAIFGDYDVDGATSSALLANYFKALHIQPLVYIPDRLKEGYGPNSKALLDLQAQGAELVITVDCGTMSFEPLATAKAAGLDVIVMDHHKGDSEMPPAFAIVNPNRFDETSPHKQLAACGVVFLLLVALNQKLKQQGVLVPDLLSFLDVVALGTVCDVVPLTGINRAFVSQGLKIMAKRGNIGIAALQDRAKITEKLTAYHLGYLLGPRINAGGRVGKSDLGVRLLSTQDPLEAREIAETLEQLNAERKAIEAQVQEAAMMQAMQLPDSDASIIVAGEGWHPGVIGIVSGRLKEHFGKPAAVIALSEGIGKASARSIAGIDLGAAVIAATHEGILVQGGGHAMAAGFTINQEKIPALRDYFNAQMQQEVIRLTGQSYLSIDAVVNIRGITTELIETLDKVAPCGAGNSSVRLVIHNVKIVKLDVAGQIHIRVIVADAGIGKGSNSLKAMAFRSLETPLGHALFDAKGKTLSLAGQAKINHWQGRESIDFVIEDVMVL